MELKDDPCQLEPELVYPPESIQWNWKLASFPSGSWSALLWSESIQWNWKRIIIASYIAFLTAGIHSMELKEYSWYIFDWFSSICVNESIQWNWKVALARTPAQPTSSHPNPFNGIERGSELPHSPRGERESIQWNWKGDVAPAPGVLKFTLLNPFNGIESNYVFESVAPYEGYNTNPFNGIERIFSFLLLQFL